MKNETLLRGIGLSIILTLAAVPTYSVFIELFDKIFATKLVIVLLAIAYISQLIFGGPKRSGRIVLFTFCVLGFTAALLSKSSVFLLLVVATGLIWSIRSLFRYQSIVCSGIDFALNGLSLGFGLWGFTATGSMIVAIWCFFLAQALSVLIPRRLRPIKNSDRVTSHPDRFSRAQSTAESAIQTMESAGRSSSG